MSGHRPGKQVWTWCPGCDMLHPFTIEATPGPTGELLNSGTTWEWDGNLEAPTFSPSLLVFSSVHLCKHELFLCPAETGGTCEERSHIMGYLLPGGEVIAPKVHHRVPEGAKKAMVHSDACTQPNRGNCHSFLRQGRWEFLGDSAHKLAGQTVEMIPLPLGWRDDA